MPRIDWDKHALLLAWAATRRSEDPYMKVGACALGHNNEVLGVAYNGLAAGKKIASGKLSDAAKKSGKLGQRARLARTLRKLKESLR